MPYKVAKRGDRFCVVTSDTGRVLRGGCHPTRPEAIAHMQAVNISMHNKPEGKVRVKTPRRKK